MQTLAEQLARLEGRLNVLSKIVVGALTPAQQAVLAQLERGLAGRQQQQQEQGKEQAGQQQHSAPHHQHHASSPAGLPVQQQQQQQGARLARASMPITGRSGSGAAAGSLGMSSSWRRSLARSPGSASLKHSSTSVAGQGRAGRAAEPLWLRQSSQTLHEEGEVVPLQALRGGALRRCASV